MRLGIVVMALAALLWSAPASGQPGPQAAAPEQVAEPDQDRPARSATLAYTIVVIALGGLGLLASIGVLCMPAPPVERERSDR
jgi:hypothetical protein